MADARAGGNQLWKLFTARARLELPHPVIVDVEARQVLIEPGESVPYVYFPLTAVLSLVLTTEAGDSTGVGIVGREGMVGLAGVLGSIEGSTAAEVLVPGTSLRIPSAALRTARAASPWVRQSLDTYTQARLIQMAQTAVCNRLHGIDGRLTRWLLAIHERVDGSEFVLSHERLAELLGVHRPTISTALQLLQRQGAIGRHARAIVVRDRHVLERLTCECHWTLARDVARSFSHVGAGPATAWQAEDDQTPPEPRADNSTEDVVREIAGRLLVVSLREQEARERAEAANACKNARLATLSRDMRIPLDSILTWCATLQRQGEPVIEEGLQAIERDARAQLALVNQLLESGPV